MSQSPPTPSAHQPLLLFLLLLVATSSSPFLAVNSQLSTADRAALLSLKRAWRNPPSLQSWNATSSPCDWPEIRCSGGETGSVTGLFLRDYGIDVGIPASISDLRNLTSLDLAYNLIPGDFPPAILNCTKLQELDLSQNLLVGSIPAEIDRLKSLQRLDVSSNNFTGDVPPTIGNLTQLKYLQLHSNLFNRSYPKEISNLASLEYLSLAYNTFSPAPIPPEFGQLKNIRYLWMRETNLIGKIPESFSNLSNLEHLDLSMNHMEGEIPVALFQLKNLNKLYLFNNRFSGSIPVEIQSLNVTEIDLSKNNLSGKIPESFGNLNNLKLLNLFSNNLYGEIPSSMGTIPSLRTFRIFKNNLSGSLPSTLGSLSKLEYFEVSDNRFTGKLPENLCSGRTLFGIVAFNNNLTGEIPESLSDCHTLRTLQLYSNDFSGKIPAGIWSLLNITSLTLSNNSLSGELPERVAWNLTRLEIDNNRFTGGIPAGVLSWSSLIVFKASNNEFTGNIPEALTGLEKLTTLFLDGNSFSGELPDRIISWKSLTSLNLARNDFSGSIPQAFASLSDLLDLDLSQNHLSGEIPPRLGNMRFTSLNLSSNKLTGKIPEALDNMAYDTSFLNNPNLCGTNLNSILGSCRSNSTPSKKVSNKILVVILILAMALLTVAIFATRRLVLDYKRKKRTRDLATWKLTSFQRVDFTEVNILASLVESNMIGSGGSGKVYKIPVDRDGQYVAVKRIFTQSQTNCFLEKAFLAEIWTLGTVRHSNIVKLLCCISNDDSKLLVYEYMENESLDKWLHGRKKKGGSRSNSSVGNIVLDWPSRLRIAIGAAQGLCYMHHDCSPSIVHRDVKSSNILLDSEFNAKIADFGLAKSLAKKGDNTMSIFAGSFGYIAPEYAYTTKVNEKVDIYSFGVVLLELVTGKEPHYGDEHTSLAEWIWKHYGQGVSMVEALDEEIKEDRYIEEMSDVLKLGIMCTSPLPSNRPSMKEVLEILQRCEGDDVKRVRNERDVIPLLGNDKYISSYRVSSKKILGDSDSSLISLV